MALALSTSFRPARLSHCVWDDDGTKIGLGTKFKIYDVVKIVWILTSVENEFVIQSFFFTTSFSLRSSSLCHQRADDFPASSYAFEVNVIPAINNRGLMGPLDAFNCM